MNICFQKIEEERLSSSDKKKKRGGFIGQFFSGGDLET